MKSRVVINHNLVKQIKKDAIAALEMTGDYVLDDVIDKQVIPFDVGTLQNESTYVDKSKSRQGTVSIISSTPYARRLYYHPEYNFQTDKNPHAKGEWFNDWLEDGKYSKNIKDAYAGFMKQLGGY